MCREEERPRREFCSQGFCLGCLIEDRRHWGDFGPMKEKSKLGPIFSLFWAIIYVGPSNAVVLKIFRNLRKSKF